MRLVALYWNVVQYSTVPPGVDVGCVGQEPSHQRIVAVSCLSVRLCKGQLERPRVTVWYTQRQLSTFGG